MIVTYVDVVMSCPLWGKQVAAMMKNCCVVGCTNYVEKKGGLRFFRFPLQDRNRCMKWEAAVEKSGIQ